MIVWTPTYCEYPLPNLIIHPKTAVCGWRIHGGTRRWVANCSPNEQLLSLSFAGWTMEDLDLCFDSSSRHLLVSPSPFAHSTLSIQFVDLPQRRWTSPSDTPLHNFTQSCCAQIIHSRYSISLCTNYSLSLLTLAVHKLLNLSHSCTNSQITQSRCTQITQSTLLSSLNICSTVMESRLYIHSLNTTSNS